MAYLIERTDQGGGYVSRPGMRLSYTHKIEHARKFTTEHEAEMDRCPGNEVIVNLETVLD